MNQWSRCRPWLVAALGKDATELDLLAQLSTGHAQLWAGERGAIVTQLVADPEKHAHVWLAGGDLAELISLMPGMLAWGRAQGCKFVAADGRPGWARVLRPFGFKPGEGGILRREI